MKRTKELKIEDVTFVLNELTQGDLINISNLSKDKNEKGQVYVDEGKFNANLLATSVKSWDFKEDGKTVLPVNKENIEKLPAHIYKDALDEAIQLNMTKKELSISYAVSGGESVDDELVNTLKLARDLKKADISAGDIHALMSMSVSEVNIMKSLMVNELQYSQIRASEEGFLNRPALSEGENSVVNKENLKINIDRQRREDEFLYRR